MRSLLVCVLAGSLVGSCSGGGSGGSSDFRLIEFLEAGQSQIPRNRELTFRFSAPVKSVQDFSARLKIQNVQPNPGSNFSLAIGTYVVVAEVVVYTPRLPNAVDRSDAGFRANAEYVVFLKGGPDALTATSDARITAPQEFSFRTNEFFEDLVPTQPPRALGLVARDTSTGEPVALDRLDPRPGPNALFDNASLLAAGNVIDPGAGGGPDYDVPWQFELSMSEPLDPRTVTDRQVRMYEVFSNATTSDTDAPPFAPPGHFGTPANFRVPIQVRVEQGPTAYRILVVPLFTLVDDTRYRIEFSGSILGLDYRKSFIGENGLTGDGESEADGAPFPEAGGLGYAVEFLVRDRGAITQFRRLTYDPLADGIKPELGQTAPGEDRWNSSLYNPASSPSTAVGFLSAFGQGTDGDLAVAGGTTTTIDTGDTPNPLMGNPFTVVDLNPDDDYLANPLPGGTVTWDTPEPFELSLTNLTVSSSSTLRIIGVNPIVFRVTGVVQVSGTIDASGGDGFDGGGAVANGGAGGPAGFPGGHAEWGTGTCTGTYGCQDFVVYLNSCANANAGFPNTFNGMGPGRGYAGGETYVYDYANSLPHGGTGGGGASHSVKGTRGEDRQNAGGSPGTPGPSCSPVGGIRNAGVIGARSESGPTYGDREAADVLLGGSGGGGGGSISVWGGGAKKQAGGGGGGGGGSITIVAAGPILVSGGVIDASGGDGGRGRIATQSAANNWSSASGGGGGGSGGIIALISGATIKVTSAILDTRGGDGGIRGDADTSTTCAGCNAGGGGAKGFIFLMDADGVVEGLIPGAAGEYDGFANGILTISVFDASRFSSVAAVTELFAARAAAPAYQTLSPGSIIALVNNAGQTIDVFLSSAQADPDDPLVPDLGTETLQGPPVAHVRFAGGSVVVDILDDLSRLNPDAARYSFLRVDARFDYQNGVEAALGPLAHMDQVDIHFTFNG